ncbi:hypothetical protein Dimus_012039 [Dionaea muscipula]
MKKIERSREAGCDVPESVRSLRPWRGASVSAVVEEGASGHVPGEPDLDASSEISTSILEGTTPEILSDAVVDGGGGVGLGSSKMVDGDDGVEQGVARVDVDGVPVAIEGLLVACVQGDGPEIAGIEMPSSLPPVSRLLSLSASTSFPDDGRDGGLVSEEERVPPAARKAMGPQPTNGLRQPPLPPVEGLSGGVTRGCSGLEGRDEGGRALPACPRGTVDGQGAVGRSVAEVGVGPADSSCYCRVSGGGEAAQVAASDDGGVARPAAAAYPSGLLSGAPSQSTPTVPSSPQVATGSIPVQSPSGSGDQGWQLQQQRRGRSNLRSSRGEQEGGKERDGSGARVQAGSTDDGGGRVDTGRCEGAVDQVGRVTSRFAPLSELDESATEEEGCFLDDSDLEGDRIASS